jgi:UDP-N-acetylglucosamine 1-carboxyvinyltransferase
VQELQKMGADMTVLDAHRVTIVGPTPLYGKEITSFDLRAGATLIIAALIAEGESIISNINQVDRGYEDIVTRLAQLGAQISRR